MNKAKIRKFRAAVEKVPKPIQVGFAITMLFLFGYSTIMRSVTDRRLKSSPFRQELKPGVWVLAKIPNADGVPELRYGWVRNAPRARAKHRNTWKIEIVVKSPSHARGEEVLNIRAWDDPQIVIVGTEESPEMTRLIEKLADDAARAGPAESEGQNSEPETPDVDVEGPAELAEPEE